MADTRPRRAAGRDHEAITPIEHGLVQLYIFVFGKQPPTVHPAPSTPARELRQSAIDVTAEQVVQVHGGRDQAELVRHVGLDVVAVVEQGLGAPPEQNPQPAQTGTPAVER